MIYEYMYLYEMPKMALYYYEEDGFIFAIGEKLVIDAVYEETETMKIAHQEFSSYLKGELREFSFPLMLKGTSFQLQVWNQLLEIPYGKTVSYQDIAIAIENKNAVRAVGGAIHNNPITVVVPCHRVIGKNGKLVGYAGGLDLKAFFLTLEQSN